MAGHGIDVNNAAVLCEFDDLAVQIVGTVRQVAVTVSYEDMIYKHGDRIRRGQSLGSVGKHSQLVWSSGRLPENGCGKHAGYHQSRQRRNWRSQLLHSLSFSSSCKYGT